MASSSSSGHGEVTLTDTSGQVSEGNMLGDESTIPLHERIQDTLPAARSTTLVMQSGNKRKEREVVDEFDYGMNHEPEVNIVDSSNIPESTYDLEPKHKVFLSHSGAQKDFVEQLCVDLERCDRYPFFDKLRSSLPIGEKFPKLIFDAIEQCRVGVVVLSEEFFMRSKWPMLELNAMVNETEKPNPCLKIIPVLYLISVNGLKNPKNHRRWQSQWEKWVREDMRINVEEWKRALRTLCAISGLVMKAGIGEVKFREEIVGEVCRLVAPELTWDDSHIEGCARLCEVIQYKMNQVPKRSKICIVGLYGVGGIGKSTIGKAMCNKLSAEFHDNVCHIELGSVPQMDLLQKVLEKFTKKNKVILDKLDDVSKGLSCFKKHLPKQQVFLVVDNVQDNFKSIEEAQEYLKGDYEQGSIILITSRTLDILKKLNVDEVNSFEMPELVEVEARALFLKSLTFATTSNDYEVLIKNSIRRCYFFKGDGERRHYHPLALKVLGKQIDSNPTIWARQLKRIDTFNQLGDPDHPIFSIFKNAFVSLKREHQLVFMDLALLLCDFKIWPIQWTFLDWLCVVHIETIEDMKDVLEILKRKSLLEEFDSLFTKFGIHDLWLEYAILEAKAQDFKNWVYHVDVKRIAFERGQQWKENVSRMCFLNWGWKSLDDMKLGDFINLVTFTLTVEIYMDDYLLDLDLSGLKHLKSLEVYTPGLKVRVEGLNSLTSIGNLYWYTPRISPAVDGIGHLIKLKYVKIQDCKGIKALDFTELKLLQVVKIIKFPDLISVRGFSSRLANLQNLMINNCNSLKHCLGLNELHALEILDLCNCINLEELPCLGKLANLKELIIAKCISLEVVPGLGDLVTLVKFDANGCSKLVILPSLMNLVKLQVLDVMSCPMQEIQGLDFLIGLTTFRASINNVSRILPSFSNLSTLKVLDIKGWNGPIWTSTQNLPMLEELRLVNCNGENLVPDLQNLEKLKSIDLFFCHNQDLLGLSNVTSLEFLAISACSKLKLPKFEKFTQLRNLSIVCCHSLIGWPNASDLYMLEELTMDGHSLMKIIPNIKILTSLRRVTLWFIGCDTIFNMASLGKQLEYLNISYFEKGAVLDYYDSPHPKEVQLPFYSSLKRLACNTPLTALGVLKIDNYVNLIEMPDLAMFPHLETLRLENCRALKKLTCSTPLIAMRNIELIGCNREIELPDMNITFPLLKVLNVKNDSL